LIVSVYKANSPGLPNKKKNHAVAATVAGKVITRDALKSETNFEHFYNSMFIPESFPIKMVLQNSDLKWILNLGSVLLYPS